MRSIKGKIVQETVETIIDHLYETSHHYMYKYGIHVYKTDDEFIKDQEEIVRQVIVEIYRRNKKKYVR